MSRRGEISPVARESTASYIARELRTAIMYGTLPPGAQLGEAALAAQLKVSRGPLREAMQRLVQEGIVRSEPNRGLFVIELDDDDIRDVYLARSAIERAAVRAILQRDTDEAVAALLQPLRQMVEAAEGPDLRALSDADLAFHEVLVDLAQSPRLRRMHQTLLVETRMCMAELERTYQRPEGVVDEHRGIVEALRSRDAQRLDEIITAHMDDALARLVSDNQPKPMLT